jgi:hypothetical protein
MMWTLMESRMIKIAEEEVVTMVVVTMTVTTRKIAEEEGMTMVVIMTAITLKIAEEEGMVVVVIMTVTTRKIAEERMMVVTMIATTQNVLTMTLKGNLSAVEVVMGMMMDLTMMIRMRRECMAGKVVIIMMDGDEMNYYDGPPLT